MPPTRLFGRDALFASLIRHLHAERPVVLSGQAGVGKSHLAREVAAQLRSEGLRVVQAQGDVVSRNIPLGAFAFLIRPEARPDPNFASAMWNLQLSLLGGDGDGVLLYVDDAHLLDPMSLLLVSRVVRTSRARTVLTARQGEDIPPALIDLWSQDDVAHVVVPPLERAGLAEMVADLLEARLSTATSREFWRLSKGNPLCARELVIEARERGRITVTDGVASHEGELSLGGRAKELIEARLTNLPETTVRALRLVAASGSLPVHDLRSIVGPDAVADLEARGLIDLLADGRRGRVSPRHPLYGELMGASMGDHERRSAAGLLYDAASARPMRRTGDARGAAEWGVAAARAVPPELLEVAAAQALIGHSPVQAERFSRAAQRGGPLGGRAGQVLANALVLQGKLDEASDLFEKLIAAATDDHELATTAILSAAMKAFSMKDFEGALVTLEGIEARVTDPAAADLLAAQRGILSIFARGCEVALAAVQPVVDRRPEAADDAPLMALGTQVTGGGLAGRVTLAERAGARAEVVYDRGADPQLQHAGTALMMRGWSIFHRGRAQESMDFVTRTRAKLPGIEAVAEVAIGVNLALQGEHAKSRECLIVVAEGLEAMLDPMGQLAWTEAIQIENAVMLGELAHAAAFSERLLARSEAERLQFGPDIIRCLAIERIGAGDRDAAEEIFGDALALARLMDQWTFSVKILDDKARFGWAPETLVELREIAGAAESDWATAHGIARHAEALAARDASALAASAEEYASWGWILRAAEIASVASAQYLTDGDRRAAYAQELRSRAWGERAEAPHSPVLRARRPVLSGRADQVALLVADGYSNAEIAEQLTLSRRTVENHLHRAYRELEVDGRGGLVDLVAGAQAATAVE